MPGWRLPSNMPPDDLRGLPRRRRGPSSLTFWLGILLLALATVGFGLRHELREVIGFFAAQQRLRIIEGTVVDARTGRPLPGVLVRVGSAGTRALGFRPPATLAWAAGRTSEAGAFRIEARVLGDPLLYLQKDGYEDTVSEAGSAHGIRLGMLPRAGSPPPAH